MVNIREFGDTEKTRQEIYNAVKDGFTQAFPREGRQTKLHIDNVEVVDKFFSKADQKKFILNDRDLTVPVRGVVTLTDKDGKVLDRKKMTLGQLPYFTPKRGTLIGKGTEYAVGNQMRLLPGVYSRIKANDEVESQFNVDGKMGFRVAMEPQTGIFKLNVGTNSLRLYPILKSLNMADDMIQQAWGKDLHAANLSDDHRSFESFYKKFSGFKYNPDLPANEKQQLVAKELEALKLNPEVTKETLGQPFERVTPLAILVASKKIVNIANGQEPQDDRDSLKYKSFHSIEDFIKERITKDAGNVARKLMYKLDKQKTLAGLTPGHFSKYLKAITRGDNRAFPLEEINPLQLLDNQYRNLVMGEGGIGNIEMVSMESRNVNPSQFGFVDPVRGPESEKIGIDTRFTINTYKGSDKKIYSKFFDAKTKEPVFLTPVDVYNSVIAFPGELEKGAAEARAFYKGQISYHKRDEIKYFLKNASDMFSIYSVLVPMTSSIQGNRLLMAGKALGDTLPFQKPEAPLVRSAKDDDDQDFETFYGKKILAELAPVTGTIKKVSNDRIVIAGKDGDHDVDLYHNFPLSRKTFFNNTPTVTVGDKVKAGQVVAKSNYSDENGTMAAGKHLLAAYLPYKGLTFEDGVVISETGSRKLATEMMYKFEVALDEDITLGKGDFVSYFPSLYTNDQTGKIDRSGLAKDGVKVVKGDPLILALKKKVLSSMDLALGNLHKTLKGMYQDASSTWEHEEPGEVTDTVITGKTAKVFVKVAAPAKVGDKLTGRFGNKGVISAIISDAEMPIVKRTGERLEAALNPYGVVSRINSSQIWEGVLSKIAKEKGLTYRVPTFSAGRNIEIVKAEMAKYGVPGKEMLEDPQGRNINAMVTFPYLYRLSKLAEAQYASREFGGYTSDFQPTKGKAETGHAMKLGTMELSSLLGHGAKANLREISTIKGQKNDDFWRALKLGYPLPTPEVPFVYTKFLAMLKAAGANVQKKGDVLQIMPLTDDEIKKLSSGEIKNAKFLNSKDFSPEKGGFFDMGITGGVTGKFWSHINLPEPMPSPIMEKPIRTLMNMTENEYRDVVAGKTLVDGKVGGAAIKSFLDKLDIPKEIAKIRRDLPNTKQSNKDHLIKKLMYLKGLRTSNVMPGQLVISKFPVLPPIFRPVTATAGGAVEVSDANKIYQNVFHVAEAFKQLKSELPEDQVNAERLDLYDNLKAAVGVGDHVNIKHEQAGVKSFIKKITGDQPKTGFFFDKVISKTQDLVGRGVAIPDPSLGIDQLGIPEEMAWQIYRPFVIQAMVKRGFSALEADENIEKKTLAAKAILEDVMKNRPAMMNRAPSLHKFSIMGFYPQLRKDKAIAMSPMVTKPYNLDHDGDTIQIHVPVTEAARQEVIEKMLPSKNLLSLKTRTAQYMPIMEDVWGLWVASTTDKKNPPIKVGSAAELDRLLKTQKLNYDDRIIIDENSWQL